MLKFYHLILLEFNVPWFKTMDYINNNNSLKNDLKELSVFLGNNLDWVQGAVAHDEFNVLSIKQIKSLEKLEKKLIKLEKEKHEIAINQINKIRNKLFPNNVLQERTDNFISFYLNHGNKFIETLIEEINPLDTNFLILSPEKN